MKNLSHFSKTDIRFWQGAYDTIQSLFAHYDLIVTPTLACLPVLNSQNGNTLGPQSVNDVPINPLLGWCLTYPVNFSGHPAASIPAGLAFGSLPVGMQIVGKRYADRDVLTASAAFEQARPWFDAYQICDSRPLHGMDGPKNPRER